jgi:hypothetical protein
MEIKDSIMLPVPLSPNMLCDVRKELGEVGVDGMAVLANVWMTSASFLFSTGKSLDADTGLQGLTLRFPATSSTLAGDDVPSNCAVPLFETHALAGGGDSTLLVSSDASSLTGFVDVAAAAGISSQNDTRRRGLLPTVVAWEALSFAARI